MGIDIVRALGIQGWMEPFELEWLASRASEARQVIEIGSWRGRSTRAIGDHCPGTVFVVDDWRDSKDHADQTNAILAVVGRRQIEREWHENLEDLLTSGRLVHLRGNSSVVAPYLRPRLGPGGADLVFIDGDHAYDGVMADIRAYEPLVRPGGILAGHDYTTESHPDVRRAVDEYFGDRVHQAPGSIWWVQR